MTEEQSPQLDERFLITRQGKQFVLFAGLLDLAHQMGIEYIKTSPVVLPQALDKNDNVEPVAIIFAEVKMADGRLFTGIGDATPSNVGRTIQPHIIRMAETRAKARALRDAVNVGVAALEELGGDEEPGEAQQRQKAERTRSNTPTPLLASEDQRAQVVDLCTKLGGTIQQLEENEGKPFGEWTRSKANKAITRLEDKVVEQREKQEANS